MDGFGEFPSAGVTEWQITPSVDGTCAGVTEWQNTASVDGLASLVVGSETRIGFCVFCSMDTFSVTKHFLRIPIKNVVSLERIFGVFSFMTSICTLYLCPFHLRKHLKEPIGLISLLSKFCKQKLDSSNSTSGKQLIKGLLVDSICICTCIYQ